MEERLADWSSWLEEHGPALLLLARQYVNSHADAEDVVHDAFLAFWKTKHRAEDPTAYLYSCVRNTSLNWIRNRRRRQQREQAQAQPESQNWFTMQHDDLQQQLTLLPTEQREVVVLKIWGHLNFRQIGEALGISSNTAASRYRYALEKLRASLSMEITHD